MSKCGLEHESGLTTLHTPTWGRHVPQRKLVPPLPTNPYVTPSPYPTTICLQDKGSDAFCCPCLSPQPWQGPFFFFSSTIFCENVSPANLACVKVDMLVCNSLLHRQGEWSFSHNTYPVFLWPLICFQLSCVTYSRGKYVSDHLSSSDMLKIETGWPYVGFFS